MTTTGRVRLLLVATVALVAAIAASGAVGLAAVALTPPDKGGLRWA